MESCEQLMREVHVVEKLTPAIIHFILPQICGLIDRMDPNITVEEMKFHNLCCNPIPSIIMNKTVDISGNLTDKSTLIRDVCRFMSEKGSGMGPGDKQFQDQYCVPNITDVVTSNYRVLSYILIGLLSPIGFFANILILLTVYKVKRLRNTTGYFICNLAIADVLVIIQMIFFLILYDNGVMAKANNRVVKYIFPSLDVFLGSASLLHVTAVSIERGIAVSMPLKYPRYLSNKRALGVIRKIWLFCLGLFMLTVLRIWIVEPLYDSIVFYFAVTCSFFIPCILVLTSYSVIMVSALKNMKMEKKIRKVIVVISMIDTENLEKVTSLRPARCREIKIALNVAIMTIPFVFGWGYFMVANVYEIEAKYLFKGFQNWLIAFLPFFVSCLNPLTYLLFTRTLRQSSWKILTRSVIFNKAFRASYNRRESVVTSTSIVANDRSFSVSETRRLTSCHEECRF